MSIQSKIHGFSSCEELDWPANCLDLYYTFHYTFSKVQSNSKNLVESLPESLDAVFVQDINALGLGMSCSTITSAIFGCLHTLCQCPSTFGSTVYIYQSRVIRLPSDINSCIGRKTVGRVRKVV